MNQKTIEAEAAIGDDLSLAAGENTSKETRRTYNLLVYGIDQKTLQAPAKPIKRKNYSLTFEPYRTPRRFSEFDGVILFQGIFEKVIHHSGGYSARASIQVECDKEELDKRHKELDLLLEQQGIACFILCERFVDRADYGSAQISDLAKVFLNYSNFYRENFANRVPTMTVKRNEFTAFLKLYGAARSYFKDLNREMELQTIATVGDRTVGFVLGGKEFFVPSLVPENVPVKIDEYFCSLADALTSTVNKLATEVPGWVNAFKFPEEQNLLERQEVLAAEGKQLDERLAIFEQFKRVLVADGDQLVKAVTHVLEDGFGFKVDDIDEYREDLKIVDAEGKPVVFAEVKGTNAGVKREHVNQADSHRERAGLAVEFPTVLIVNTHIKNARTLEEKDKPVPGEQIAHAARNKVVILRTLDLLGLVALVNKGAMPAENVLGLLRGAGGWLRVWGSPPELVQQ